MRLRAASLVLGLIFCLGIIAVLSRDVIRELDSLSTSQSDNDQWTLSQLEVDTLGLKAALLRAKMADPKLEYLADVRRHFDIFYSRLQIVGSGVFYALVRDDPYFAEAIGRVQSFAEHRVPVIDGPGEGLTAALEQMFTESEAVRRDVRIMALRGMSLFTLAADNQREHVSVTMVRVATVTLALVIVLILLAGVLARLYRVSQTRAQQIRQAGERMEAIVGTSLDAVLVADREGRLLEFNGAAENIFGYARDEVLGQKMTDILFPEDFTGEHCMGIRRDVVSGSISTIGTGRSQLSARRKSGEIFPVEATVSLVGRGGSEICISYMRDITEQLADEQALRTARDEALSGARAKAEFLAVMSHEMRTPLNGLLGSMELLGSTELDPRQKRYLEAMAESGRLLLHHVNDVLDIARSDAQKLHIAEADFDLIALLANIVQTQKAVARSNGNTVSVNSDWPDSCIVRGDERRLRQVLLNLVGNAIKFTRNGEITLEVENVGCRDAAALIELRVIDTGIGIAEADLSRIFEDFVTLDTSYGRLAQGTGLGLSISRRLVHALGGEIGAESVQGQGSLFWLRVPMQLREGPLADTVAAPPPQATIGQPRNILIVEDNRINRYILKEMLESLGHTVAEAQDGLQGIGVADAIAFDLILMDISMPQLDGVAATRAIRNGSGKSRETRIVALTAHAMPVEVASFRAAGMEGCLTKPVTRENLANLLAAESSVAPRVKPAAPLLDPATIREFTETVPAGVARDLVARFIAEGQQTLAALADIPNEDAVSALPALHRLAGAAATFGARPLHAALSRIEANGKVGRPLDLSELDPLWHDTRLALEVWQAEIAAA